MAHCCTYAANITKDNRNRRDLYSMICKSSSLVLLEIFAGIIDQNCTFTWSTESWISMSSMFQSLSALITAESMLVLCSNCLAHCHKRKLHYTLNDNSKHNDCFVCHFFDIL